MKIECISDTHNQLDKIKLAGADLLIIAGDLTMRGTEKEYIKFNEDLENIKGLYKHGVMIINGNHDFLGESNFNKTKYILTNVNYYLQDSGVEIEEIKFHGSPATPWFHSWAFNYHRGKDIQAIWNKIPLDTNVLIVHGPPFGIMDEAPRGVFGAENVGCKDLLNKVNELKELKLMVYGHIHHAAGKQIINNITFVNASSCTEEYKPTNPPIIVEI